MERVVLPKLGYAFGRDVRRSLFHTVGEYSAREVAHFGTPSLITRITNDVQQVQMLAMMGATMLVMAPLMSIGGIVMAVRQDVGLSWILAVSIPAGTLTRSSAWPRRRGNTVGASAEVSSSGVRRR